GESPGTDLLGGITLSAARESRRRRHRKTAGGRVQLDPRPPGVAPLHANAADHLGESAAVVLLQPALRRRRAVLDPLLQRREPAVRIGLAAPHEPAPRDADHLAR